MATGFTLSSRVVRNADHISTSVGDETVIVNVELGKFFELDAVGRAIWDRLASEVTVQSLVQSAVEEFEGDPRQIGEDVLTFLNQLQEYQLVSQATDDRDGTA